VPENAGSIKIADEKSASALLYDVLGDTIAAFPEELGESDLPPTPGSFRKAYPDWLPQFEALRLASPSRGAIARYATSAVSAQLEWVDASGSMPLGNALMEPTSPLSLSVCGPSEEPGWPADFVYRGERWPAERLIDFAGELAGRSVITPAAERSLTWVDENLLEGGMLRLSGRKIVVLGGGAEMASTRLFLEAGADVLWIDIVPPPSDWSSGNRTAGTLHWPTEGADLLTQPKEILATIIAFANGSPVDVCLYAYAPGQAREIRLTGAMNAMVDALPAELVSTITMLVSPTTPTALEAEDIAMIDNRRENSPFWESMLSSLRILGKEGCCINRAGTATTRTVVSIQGTSYQAAQYLGKVLKAECWANESLFRVSANTAAITRTRSIEHPVFAAAFGGAAAFGVETFTPRLSRRVNGLLAISDWLQPERPVQGRVRVHGGIHTLPYPLESALVVAAGLGFIQSPRLLKGLFK
jgi:hypothetical protein